MQTVVNILEMLRRYGRCFGPYLMVEILLPGGTLFALLLFLYRRRKLDGVLGAARAAAAQMRAGAEAVCKLALPQSPNNWSLQQAR